MSMLRMILCPFPAFFRFLMLLIVPSSIRFVDTTRVTISLYRRHPLAAPSTLLSRQGSRARGSTGRCRDRRERERKRERQECADTRSVTKRNRKNPSLSMAPAFKDECDRICRSPWRYASPAVGFGKFVNSVNKLGPNP